jgi:hypothetical protein
MDTQLKRGFIIALVFGLSSCVQGQMMPITTGSPIISFNPPAGTYTGAQSLTVSSRAASTSPFYTLDGTTPSMAATLYGGPVSVASTSAMNAASVKTFTVAQNTGTANPKWKCVTVAGGTFGSLTCQTGGGIGTNQPTNVTWTFGSTMAETMTGAPGTQILFVYSGTAADNSNAMAQDRWVQATVDKTILQNNEMDMYQYDSSRARLHMFGLQCNQQAALGRWQLDNQQGSWVDTPGSIRDCCPIPTSGWCHVVLEGHWDLNDTTGCGGSGQYNNGVTTTGYGCEVFDALTITQCSVAPVNGVCPAGNITLGPTRHALNVTMNSYTEAGWASVCGNQDQLDLVSSGSPMTAGRNVIGNNVTCGTYHSGTTARASYTIN